MAHRIGFLAIIFVMILSAFPALGSDGDVSKETITVMDLAGRTVSLDLPVERVVITFNFEEYLAAEGGDDPFERIAGWTRNYWDGRRQWTWEKYTDAFPEIEDIPDVGYIHKGTFSTEKVLSLKPDVVIMCVVDYEAATDDVKKLEEGGVPVVCVDYHSETLESHSQSTMLLGTVLGREERAQELVDFYQEQVEEVTSGLENLEEPKPTVYVEVGNKGPAEYSSTYGKDFMWGALVDQCGGINIADDIVETSAPINPEYLLIQNPDVIIITGSYWPSYNDSMRLGYYAEPAESRLRLESFTERPGWDGMKAVRDGKIYAIHHALSRHIYDFVALQYMAKCLHPEEFEDLDPEERFEEFHQRFLPVEYSGVWMTGL
jgi:iron complex transport system substrate-binding protein